MRNFALPIVVALFAAQAFGCTTKTVTQSPPAGQQAPAEGEPAADTEETTPAEQAEKFGDPLDPSTPVVPLAELLAKPEAYENKQITTSGNVRQVCQQRGCWAEIRESATSEGKTMRVTFKGYLFFLPKDSKGANVKIEGQVSVELLSPEHVEHLESEGASFQDKRPDGSALAIEFIASGVEMTGRK